MQKMNYVYNIGLFRIIFYIIISYKMLDPFIVENAINTCYIDSLIMALLYKNSPIDNILSKDLKNGTGVHIYLQEYIKEKFVNLVRNNKSVLSEDVEMIRVISSQIGWFNNEEYMNQQDVTEFYCFLADIFEFEKIMIQRKSLLQNNNNKLGEKETIPYIPLYLPECQNITVKKMLSDWQYDNISHIENTKSLNTYDIINSPLIIGLAINRFSNEGIRIDTNVIIQKKIHLNEKVLQTDEWYFHAAICHRGNSLKEGHYYTLISGNDGVWYIFDDLQVPCMREVKMDDYEITNMLKKECFFLIYRHS